MSECGYTKHPIIGDDDGVIARVQYKVPLECGCDYIGDGVRYFCASCVDYRFIRPPKRMTCRLGHVTRVMTDIVSIEWLDVSLPTAG